MRRASAILVLVMIAAACGGGEESTDESAPTAAPASTEAAAPAETAAPAPTTPETTDAPATTAAPDEEPAPAAAPGGSTEFCDFYAQQTDAQTQMNIFDPESVEAAMRDSLDAIGRGRELAPREIKDDVDRLADAFEDFAAALEEANWNFAAIDLTDPRVAVMESGEFIAVAERLDAFCGVDGGSADDSGPAPSPPAVDSGDLPSGLIPPGATDVQTTGVGIAVIFSSASYDEAIAHYSGVLGRDPVNVSGDPGSRVATFIGDFEGSQTLVEVKEADGRLQVSISR